MAVEGVLDTNVVLPKVKEAAIRLRRRHGIKLPDAVIAATARVLRAELLTNDLRLLRLPGLSCKQLRLKKPEEPGMDSP